MLQPPVYDAPIKLVLKLDGPKIMVDKQDSPIESRRSSLWQGFLVRM